MAQLAWLIFQGVSCDEGEKQLLSSSRELFIPRVDGRTLFSFLLITPTDVGENDELICPKAAHLSGVFYLLRAFVVSYSFHQSLSVHVLLSSFLCRCVAVSFCLCMLVSLPLSLRLSVCLSLFLVDFVHVVGPSPSIFVCLCICLILCFCLCPFVSVRQSSFICCLSLCIFASLHYLSSFCLQLCPSPYSPVFASLLSCLPTLPRFFFPATRLYRLLLASSPWRRNPKTRMCLRRSRILIVCFALNRRHTTEKLEGPGTKQRRWINVESRHDAPLAPSLVCFQVLH